MGKKDLILSTVSILLIYLAKELQNYHMIFNFLSHTADLLEF